MRIKVLLLFIQLFVIAPVNVPAQNNDLNIQFARELKEKCGDVKSIVCKFVQTRSASVLAQDADKHGKYYFLQPYNVLLAFDDGDYIKITSTMFETKQNGRVNATKAGSNPMLKSLNRMLSACISGDASQITSGFDTEITANKDEFRLKLLPLRGRTGKKATETLLVFNRKDMSLKMMKMTQATGDFLQYRFHDVKYNTDIAPSLFDIK